MEINQPVYFQGPYHKSVMQSLITKPKIKWKILINIEVLILFFFFFNNESLFI